MQSGLKRHYFIGILILSAVFFCSIWGCDNDDEKYQAYFAAQNTRPHQNAISLQRGESAEEIFEVVLWAGKLDKVSFLIWPPKGELPDEGSYTEQSESESAAGKPPLNLVNVTRITTALEFWGDFFDFTLEWEKGDFFEARAADGIVEYDVGLPYIAENGLTYIPIDIWVPNPLPPAGKLKAENGKIMSLKFRALRSVIQIPLNFEGRFGSLYDESGEELTGISWFGGTVEIVLR